jgi:hypothetical protein
MGKKHFVGKAGNMHYFERRTGDTGWKRRAHGMAICTSCGEWTEPPVLDRDDGGLIVVCPHCQYREPFTQYPLWWIAGSPGAGKTTLIPLLRRYLPGYIVFEGEAIDFWRFEGEPGDYSSLHNQWLKVAYEIALNGPPVVFIATAFPDQLDACTMRSRFSSIAYLGLVCSEDAQRRRLLDRPAWRKSAAPEFIASSCGFTRRLEEVGRQDSSAVVLHDTTTSTPDASARLIAAWVRDQSAHNSRTRGA